MSRGREENHAHLEVEQQLDVDVERAPDARADGAEVLRQIIARDGAERSATETLREEMDAPHRLDCLVPQYVHAIEMLGTERQQDKRDALAGVFGQQQAAAMLADPAGDALLAELNHHPDMAAPWPPPRRSGNWAPPNRSPRSSNGGWRSSAQRRR